MSEDQLKAGVLWLAWLCPGFNYCFALWGHARAYRRGHLHGGAELGAAFGILGVIAAGLLTTRQQRSLALARELSALPPGSQPRWWVGLLLMLAGSAMAFHELGLSALRLPQSKSSLLLGSLALLALLGGRHLIAQALPPAQFCPPLDDSREYEEELPDFARHLREAREYYLRWHRAGLQRNFSVGLGLTGFVFVLAGSILLLADPDDAGSLAIRWSGAIALVSGLPMLIAGLRLNNRANRERQEQQDAQNEEAALNAEEGSSIPREDRRKLYRLNRAITRSLIEWERNRNIASYLTGLLLVASLKGLLGLFGIQPWPGPLSAWFLAPLVFAWVPWLCLRRARMAWENYLRDTRGVSALALRLNASLGQSEQISLPAQPLARPADFDLLRVSGRLCWSSLVLLVCGDTLKDPLSVSVWLAVSGIAAGINWRLRRVQGAPFVETLIEGKAQQIRRQREELARQLQEHRFEKGEQAEPADESDSEQPPRAVSSAEPDSRAAAEPAQAETESAGSAQPVPDSLLQQQQNLLDVDERLQKLRIHLLNLGSGMLGVLSLVIIVCVMGELSTTQTGSPEALSLLEGLVTGICLILSCLILGSFNQRFHSRLLQLPRIYLDPGGLCDLQTARLGSQVRQLRQRLLQRVLGGSLWLLFYLILLAHYDKHYLRFAQQLELLPWLFGLKYGCLLLALGSGCAILLNGLALRRTRTEARRLAKAWVRREVDEWLVQQRERELLIVEDHGPFSVEYAPRIDIERLEQLAKRRESELSQDKPFVRRLDLLRSCLYIIFLLCLAQFLGSGWGEHLNPALLVPLFCLQLASLGGAAICGSLLRTRYARWQK